MHNAEYKSLKQFFATELGADDKESMEYHAIKMKSPYRLYMIAGILLSMVSIPFVILPFLGIPLIVAGVLLALHGRKEFKKMAEFMEFVRNDPDIPEKR